MDNGGYSWKNYRVEHAVKRIQILRRNSILPRKFLALSSSYFHNSGCSVAQLVARWLAVRQARVRISARHPMEVPSTEPTAVKIWRWAGLSECL
jgi:hypothetical protein